MPASQGLAEPEQSPKGPVVVREAEERVLPVVVRQDLSTNSCLTVDAIKKDTIQTHPRRAFYFSRNPEEQEERQRKEGAEASVLLTTATLTSMSGLALSGAHRLQAQTHFLSPGMGTGRGCTPQNVPGERMEK